jgi:hypothetical protein
MRLPWGKSNVRALGLTPMVARSTPIQSDSISSPRVGRPATTSPRTGMGQVVSIPLIYKGITQAQVKPV